MNRSAPVIGLSLWLLLWAGDPTAQAADYLADSARLWRPHRVYYPVASNDIRPRGTEPPANARNVRGVVEVTPSHAAVFWLDGLRVVRVRAVEPKNGALLRFGRVTDYRAENDSMSARALVDEPGIPVSEGVYYLAQPPGAGSVWYVNAKSPVKIQIEHLEDTLGHTEWESIRRSVLDWIAADKGDINLPPFDSMGEIRARLIADRDIGRAIVEAWPDMKSLPKAVIAWRTASALQQLSTVRPLLRDYFRLTRLDSRLADLGVRVKLGEHRPYRRLDTSDRTWKLSLDGPGVLRVEVRALLPGGPVGNTRPTISVRVETGERVLGSSTIEPYPVNATVSAPDAVFPVRSPLSLPSGELVGPTQRLSLATLPGRREYALTITGGPALVRATYGQRRSLARDRLRASDHAGDFIERATAVLGADDSVGARFMRIMLADLSGQKTDIEIALGKLPPLAALLAELAWARADVRTLQPARLTARAVSVLADVPFHLGWYLRVHTAGLLSNHGYHGWVRELLSAAESSPPDILLSTLAAALPPPEVTEMSRSRRVGMMDLAWRSAPDDESIRRRYQTIWRQDSVWQRLRPTVQRERRLQRDLSMWLKRDDKARGRPNAWGLMPLGKSIRVLAPPAPSDGTRPALMRLAVSTPMEQPGPVTVTIDGQSFTDVAMRSIDRWQFAIAPGPHELRVEAPAGTEIYCSLPAEGDAYVGAARIQRAWPLAIGGRPVRYDLPAPHVQGPVRVRLRALLTRDMSYRSTVRMVTDLGPSRTIQLEWGEVDGDARVVDSSTTLSAAASLVITPPVGAHHIWFESTSEIPIIASVAVRRPRDEPLVLVPEVRMQDEQRPALEQISALSEKLSDSRPSSKALLERAHLLLDLGFPNLARRDAARALRPGSRDKGLDERLMRELLSRLNTIRSPAHLSATSPVGRAEKATPIFPAALALPGRPSPAIVRAARALRAGTPQAALELLAEADVASDPRVRYARVRVETSGDQSGQSLLASGRRLVSLHEDTRAWQVARHACTIFGQLLELGDIDPGIASFAYGVARELDGLGTLPIARRVLLMASPLSKWSAIRSADATGGYQRVMVETGPAEREPQQVVREALVAAPWRADLPSHSVRPGRSVALQVNLLKPASLRADIWCRQLRMARTGESSDCRVTVLVDGRAIASAADGQVFQRRAVELGRAIYFTTPVLDQGVHRIEVELSRNSRSHRAAVRFSGYRALPESLQRVDTESGPIYPIQMRKPTTAFVTTPEPDRKVVVTVNGPTALLLTGRSSAVAAASTLKVAVESMSGARLVRAMTLPTEVDRRAALREGLDKFRELRHAATVVIPVPGEGPHRVTVAPDSGIAYVRMAMRVDRANGERVTPNLWKPDVRPEDEFLRWPGAPAEMAVLDGGYWRRPHERGTFSVEATVRRNDLDEVEDVPLLTRLDVAVNWRRRVIDDLLWVYVGVNGRQFFNGRSVFGGRARLQTSLLPGGLRAYAQARLYTQVVDTSGLPDSTAELEWRVTARVDIERPMRLTADWSLIPELSVRTSDLSLTFDEVPVPGPEIDPDVYSLYAFFHRHTVIPRIALRWRPFQDQIGSWSISAVPNTDLASLDRVQTTLSWSSVVHLARRRVAVARVSYRPSYRFYDEDRFDGYARHDFSARIETSLWTGRTGRLLLQARAATYLSRLHGRNDTFSIGLAYDLTGGRGLRDMFSFEEEFDPWVEGRRFTYDDVP